MTKQKVRYWIEVSSNVKTSGKAIVMVSIIEDHFWFVDRFYNFIAGNLQKELDKRSDGHRYIATFDRRRVN